MLLFFLFEQNKKNKSATISLHYNLVYRKKNTTFKANLACLSFIKVIMNIFFQYKIKIAFLLSVAFYLLLNILVYVQDQHYYNELQKFDLNQNGFFSKEEITPAQQLAQKKVVSDTARNFAPFTLIPVSLIIGIFLFFSLKIGEKLTQKKLEN